MPLELYYIPLSPPVRGVLLAAKGLDVKIDCKLVNLYAGEHMTPEYAAMNPQKTVPLLNDNGFYLWESRAIIQYLANKYGKDDSLYPKDPVKRAVVDHRLYFDFGTLYGRFFDYAIPVVFGREPNFSPAKKTKVEDALVLFDGLLDKSGGWAAGPNMTIADFSLAASVASIEASELFDLSKYQNVCKWLARCKAEMKGYAELNHDGAQQFGQMVKSKTAGK